MKTSEMIMELHLYHLLQAEVKRTGAHVFLHTGVPEPDANGTWQIPVTAEFDNAARFSALLNAATARRLQEEAENPGLPNYEQIKNPTDYETRNHDSPSGTGTL